MSGAKKTPEITNYRVIEKLGEGGMASVWVAQRVNASQLCVVKVLHDHLGFDRVVQSRFIREAQVASLLHHPNVARLFDADVSAETSFLAMEFIPGIDLESMMFKLWDVKKLPPPELSLTISLHMLEGLHYAHEFRDGDGRHLEIVHRDLSPRNVMVTFDGDVKIIDFGLVRTNLGEFRTAPGMIAGTLRYMSPEQATADKIDRRSDVYTWGVVLYELLTGQPFIKATEARTILGAVVVDVPPPLSHKNPHLPRALDAVLAKALEKDPENRFHTAEEFRVALAMASGELGVAKKQKIGDFITGLFPEERARTLRRLEVTMEIPAGPEPEPTRAGVPQPEPPPEASMPTPSIEVGAMYELTRTGAAPRAPRPPARVSSAWMIAGLAVLVALMVSVATLIGQDEEEPILPDERPALVERPEPRPQATVVAPRVDEDVPPPLPPSRPKPRKAVARVETKPIVAPPPPFDADAELAKFQDEIHALGARGQEIVKQCGASTLVARLGTPDEAKVRVILERCRAAMKP